MFEELVKKVMETDSPEKVNLNLYQNPVFNPDALNRIMEKDGMTDRDMFNFVKESYRSILDDIFHRNDMKYLEVFSSPKFLTALIQVIGSIPELEYSIRTYCNKLAYDYITLKNNDAYTKQLFFSLSRTVNRDKIPVLLGIGIPEEIASYLVLSRYSSLDDAVNIKRLNFVIITQSPELMTMDMIIRIYQRLFTKMTTLFETVMFDVINDEDNDEWMTDSILEVNGTINLAILAMLEVMPIADIQQVLTSYAEDYRLVHVGEGPRSRFSMKAISQGDYPRITLAIENLAKDHMYIP